MRATTVIHQFAQGPWGNFIHLIGCLRSKTCAVVDPAWNAPTILTAAAKQGWRITDVLCTHSHVDHVNRVDAVVAATDARVHMLRAEVQFSGFKAGNLHMHRSGDVIEVGRTHITAIHTPGHTPGSTSYWHGASQSLITGDTLFVGGCGRCDLQGGDPVMMFESLKMLREKMPQDTKIYPGHDYGATATSTLGHEAQTNRFMVLPNIFDFVAVRMKGRVPNTKLSEAPAWQPG